MKKKTYTIISHIPVLGPVVRLICEPQMCSPGMADGVYDPVREYAKLHPDIQITKGLVQKILRESRKT